jgi:molybdate transport system substrate-binding protein
MRGIAWAGGARPGILALLLCLMLAAGACSGDHPGSGAARADDGAGGGSEVLVFAASSLTEAFGETGRRFEEVNPTATVRFVFGPSDALAAQINNGAPADVFASASETWMEAVHDQPPGVSAEGTFARNRLVIITPPDDPAGISSLEDLGEPGVKLVLAAEDVPAGTYAREALDGVGVAERAEANVVSNEEDVKAVVQKVLLGEADAGIAYVTDLTTDVESSVRAVPIPRADNVIATYPIAVVASSEHATLAGTFVEYVRSSVGQDVLRSYGFLPPP